MACKLGMMISKLMCTGEPLYGPLFFHDMKADRITKRDSLSWS